MTVNTSRLEHIFIFTPYVCKRTSKENGQFHIHIQSVSEIGLGSPLVSLKQYQGSVQINRVEKQSFTNVLPLCTYVNRKSNGSGMISSLEQCLSFNQISCWVSININITFSGNSTFILAIDELQ